MSEITSKSNPYIKHIKKLMTSAAYREEQGMFVLEGVRLCFEVLRNPTVYPPETLLVTHRAEEKHNATVRGLWKISEQATYISEEVAEKLSETETPQGIFVICRKEPQRNFEFGNCVIAMDNVQDPANVGAIIRSAEALGIDTVVAAGCCDVYNPKVLRASMGGVLRQTVITTNDLPPVLLALAPSHDVYATVPASNDAVAITALEWNRPCVFVIGNEANGVSEAVKDVCHRLVTIPMQGMAESLNAAAAAAITMWEMVKNKKQ